MLRWFRRKERDGEQRSAGGDGSGDYAADAEAVVERMRGGNVHGVRDRTLASGGELIGDRVRRADGLPGGVGRRVGSAFGRVPLSREP